MMELVTRRNCKSMLYSHVTPPSMISGVRESAEYAVRAGFKFIQFFEPEEEMAKCCGRLYEILASGA